MCLIHSLYLPYIHVLYVPHMFPFYALCIPFICLIHSLYMSYMFSLYVPSICSLYTCPISALYVPYISHCLVPAQTGPCRASFPRWFYSARDGSCRRFTYGGCQGNGNNYGSREACEERCARG
uniref:Uncharacterized protein n=1 Tax=Melopsittacus undulatus TaxID=13146 RepID=A0A8C6JAY7_MELUD